MIGRATYRPGMVLGPRDVYAGRGRGRVHMNSGLAPGTWGWLGNPYDEKIYGLERCIAMFAEAFIAKLESDATFKAVLDEIKLAHRRGERLTLVCWCQPGSPCHTQVIACWLDS